MFLNMGIQKKKKEYYIIIDVGGIYIWIRLQLSHVLARVLQLFGIIGSLVPRLIVEYAFKHLIWLGKVL